MFIKWLLKSISMLKWARISLCRVLVFPQPTTLKKTTSVVGYALSLYLAKFTKELLIPFFLRNVYGFLLYHV